jgi:CRISPR-associated protein Cas1
MEQLTDLKAILHSKRANIYHLEKCRVMQKDGRVLYLTKARHGSNEENQYWNIPIANRTCLLLGTGTSITQAAMRILAQTGVLVGFSGGGTPLLMATEARETTDIEWRSPQSEYRPTKYLKGWMSFWFDDEKRLLAAKQFQHARLDYLERVWSKDRDLINACFDSKGENIISVLNNFRNKIDRQEKVEHLLQAKAVLTKQLYKIAASNTKHEGFIREHNGKALDNVNSFLNHGNYLAYGMAATMLWVLGIPHGFSIMHGKTRRGALVFDIADLIKDTLVLLWAFICAKEGVTEQEFRQQCLKSFATHKAMDFMFDQVEIIAMEGWNNDASDINNDASSLWLRLLARVKKSVFKETREF